MLHNVVDVMETIHFSSMLQASLIRHPRQEVTSHVLHSVTQPLRVARGD